MLLFNLVSDENFIIISGTKIFFLSSIIPILMLRLNIKIILLSIIVYNNSFSFCSFSKGSSYITQFSKHKRFVSLYFIGSILNKFFLVINSVLKPLRSLLLKCFSYFFIKEE